MLSVDLKTAVTPQQIVTKIAMMAIPIIMMIVSGAKLLSVGTDLLKPTVLKSVMMVIFSVEMDALKLV